MSHALTALRTWRALLAVFLAGGCMPPSWAAAALLHPGRSMAKQRPGRAYQTVDLEGAGVRLKGWYFRAEGPVRRGTIVYLHGIGDNRGSGAGIADRYVPAGFDVLAFDSRAHGESEGAACTYGVYERQDLLRVLDRVEAHPIALIGVSLGAAVALQTAALTNEVATVVAVSAFADLRTVAEERAPFVASRGNIEDAFRTVEGEGKFLVADASPVAAAARLSVPVLLIHGAADRKTSPLNSQRIYRSLRGVKRLILVAGAGHDDVPNQMVWREVDDWLQRQLATARSEQAHSREETHD
jgi:pimeloyl-ACP methyl ester carboxylesterase